MASALAPKAATARAVASRMRLVMGKDLRCDGDGGCGKASRPREGSLDAAGFVEAKPRRAREDAGAVAVAAVDQEVGADPGAGEERRVGPGVVAAGHRPGEQRVAE